MEGFIQAKPGSEIWKRSFFSEFLVKKDKGEEVIVPSFERFFIIATDTVEGDESHIRGLLSAKGKVSRFEVAGEEGIMICLGVMEKDRKGVMENDRKTANSLWRRLFKKPGKQSIDSVLWLPFK